MNTREQLLNSKNVLLRDKRLTIKIGETEIEVLAKCPTVGQRNRWRDSEGGAAGMLVQVVLDCSFDPATNKPLFEQSDRDLLLEQHANSWVDQIGTAIMELMSDAESTAKKD